MATSKRDYEAIAAILARHKASDEIITDIAAYFASTNPAFRRTLFTLRCCGARDISARKARNLNLNLDGDEIAPEDRS